MRAPLVLLSLLLAGCAGQPHDHGATGEAIVGVRNLGATDATFTLVVASSGHDPEEHTVTVPAGQTVERIFAVAAEGEHRARVSWTNGTAEDAWDPSACASYHVVFAVDPADAAERTAERTRECH